MIYLLYQQLIEWLDPEGSLRSLVNLLRYVTFRAGGACITAFFLSVIFGGRVIRGLISLKVGQPIRSAAEVHRLNELHGGKAGTPTMGGILFVGTTLLSGLLWARLSEPFIWVILGVTIALGGLGFVDDYLKVSRKSADGLSARWKLIVQVLIAGVAGIYLCYFSGETTMAYIRQLFVPGGKNPILYDLGWLMPPFIVLIIVGTSNAVNLTDGLDGLATGCSITATGALGMYAYMTGHAVFAREYLFLPYHPGCPEVFVLCMAFIGAAFGFLWFNCHPAKVFMGDTGSLAIGGFLASVAICCKQELLLPIIGGVFVMEALSVIIQVASFKITGKRVFRMAPIHHHFELGGWKETQVISRLWIVSLICALIGLAFLKVR
jgi:phospho-N-acetylmuramoyl-pentapeptide-transferase